MGGDDFGKGDSSKSTGNRKTSWWFFTNPSEKICAVVKLDISPNLQGENSKKRCETST